MTGLALSSGNVLFQICSTKVAIVLTPKERLYVDSLKVT